MLNRYKMWICGDCDKTKCPNGAWNRELVDEIIKVNFEWVDLNDPESIRKARVKISKEVKNRWISPCWSCLQIDSYLISLRLAQNLDAA